ncbi:MAG TPA: YebC/PmpR family DNA-binding transcriptional regulator [Dehalococcoidia bacterium]|nr:YebC/PmpR family DNA-binding transcriptional regulator [Dehalococcoidia bacterium]
MSGHSKWAQIKRQKGVADARRGQLFGKLIREITVAVREGGADPQANVRLRLAVQKARDNNMPSENIERAIKRASGEAQGEALSEMILEGYGPGGAAIMVQAMTDNRNRTLQEVRNTFSRAGGSLGEAGSVAWNFNFKGVITIEAGPDEAEALALKAIDAGAEDVRVEPGFIEIYTEPAQFEAVRRALEGQGLHITSAELSQVPKATVILEERDAIQTLKLLDRLEELDDIQKVYCNLDYSEEVLEKLKALA